MQEIRIGETLEATEIDGPNRVHATTPRFHGVVRDTGRKIGVSDVTRGVRGADLDGHRGESVWIPSYQMEIVATPAKESSGRRTDSARTAVDYDCARHAALFVMQGKSPFSSML